MKNIDVLISDRGIPEVDLCNAKDLLVEVWVNWAEQVSLVSNGV